MQSTIKSRLVTCTISDTKMELPVEFTLLAARTVEVWDWIASVSCREFDAPSFDPDYDTLSVEEFLPLVRRFIRYKYAQVSAWAERVGDQGPDRFDISKRVAYPNLRLFVGVALDVWQTDGARCSLFV